MTGSSVSICAAARSSFNWNGEAPIAGVKLKPSREYDAAVVAIAERDFDHIGQVVVLELGLAIDNGCRDSQPLSDQHVSKWSWPITPISAGLIGADRARIAYRSVDAVGRASIVIRQRLALADAELPQMFDAFTVEDRPRNCCTNSRTEGDGLRLSSAWAISDAIRSSQPLGTVPVRRGRVLGFHLFQAGSVAVQETTSSPNHVAVSDRCGLSQT